MRISSRTLACFALTTLLSTVCNLTANAGDLYREGLFLAYLEQTDLPTLPELVDARDTNVPSELTGPTITPVGAESSFQISAGSVTHVASAGSVTQVTTELESPIEAEFIQASRNEFSAPCVTECICEAETIGCPSCQCQQDGGWICKKNKTLNNKIYFKQHLKHKKTLYPVVRPHCQPAYGIYETCWRQIVPNNCCYRCEEYVSDSALLPEPQQLQQVPPAPPAGQEAGESPTKANPRPYEN